MLGSDIIADADARVPNTIETPFKITWLNEVHSEFFEVVKIPATATFTTASGQDSYTLTGPIRSRNIVEVMVGTERYRSILFDQALLPGFNYYDFDESTGTLKLLPAPSRTGLPGRVRYYRVPETVFTADNYTYVEPDAPREFHWVYVAGLCARIAKSMQDVRLAQNFDQDYRAGLLIAQQNLNLFRPENPLQPQSRSEG